MSDSLWRQDWTFLIFMSSISPSTLLCVKYAINIYLLNKLTFRLHIISSKVLEITNKNSMWVSAARASSYHFLLLGSATQSHPPLCNSSSENTSLIPLPSFFHLKNSDLLSRTTSFLFLLFGLFQYWKKKLDIQFLNTHSNFFPSLIMLDFFLQDCELRQWPDSNFFPFLYHSFLLSFFSFPFFLFLSPLFPLFLSLPFFYF